MSAIHTPLQVRDNRKQGYYWIATELIRRDAKTLGKHGIFVYNILASYAGNEDQTAWPSIATMAEITGVSQNFIRKGIKALVNAKWITFEGRVKPGTNAQTSHLYTLLDVPALPSKDDPLHEMKEGGSQNEVPPPSQNEDELSPLSEQSLSKDSGAADAAPTPRYAVGDAVVCQRADDGVLYPGLLGVISENNADYSNDIYTVLFEGKSTTWLMHESELTPAPADPPTPPEPDEPEPPAKKRKPDKAAAKDKPDTPHTAMKNAIVAAFGWYEDDVTDQQWGLLNKASKELRGVNLAPDDVPDLYKHVKRTLPKDSNFGPGALANYVADYRATQRKHTTQFAPTTEFAPPSLKPTVQQRVKEPAA